jgi:hypothetical protein
MSGYIPFLLQYAFMVWTALTSPFSVYLRSILIQSPHLWYLRLSLHFLTKMSNSLLISYPFHPLSFQCPSNICKHTCTHVFLIRQCDNELRNQQWQRFQFRLLDTSEILTLNSWA